jgi:hypothetical protein
MPRFHRPRLTAARMACRHGARAQEQMLSTERVHNPETYGRAYIFVWGSFDMRLSIWFSLAGLLLIAFAVSLRGRMPAPS